MRTVASLVDFSAARRPTGMIRRKQSIAHKADRIVFVYRMSRTPIRGLGWELETQESKRETFLRVRVVDAVELGDLEAHHIFRGNSHHFFFAVGVGEARDGFRRHGCVLLVDFAMNDEKGPRPA